MECELDISKKVVSVGLKLGEKKKLKSADIDNGKMRVLAICFGRACLFYFNMRYPYVLIISSLV